MTMSHVSAYSATSSALYQSTLEGTGMHRETLQDRMIQTKLWLYNPEEGTVMGRHPIDWGFLLAFYTAFLVFLALMSSAFCGFFFWVIDWNFPTMQGSSSLLQTPGMGFRPQPDVNSRLVRFVKGDGATYVHYLDHIEAYIQYYENELQQGENYMDCNDKNNIMKRRPEKDLDKVCVFDPQILGDDCVKQQNYGFDDGQPCILLKLNKVFDWVPEEYQEETMHPDLTWTNETDPFYVTVVCDGDDAATRENMGDILIYPPQGFPFKYFPFRNQQGYRSPLVFLRFDNPHPGILLMMTCKAYAKNIIHDRTSEVGQVSFEVLVD